jgi:hypothetical protein
MYDWTGFGGRVRLHIEAGCHRSEAVFVAAAWISVIGSAVTAIAAFGGVLLAQRATRTRDLEGRIWERRSGVYEELVKWVLVINRAADDLPSAGESPEFSDEQARALLPSPDLEARVTAYASAQILRDFRHCCRLLSSSGRRNRTQDALWAVSGLGDDIRRELRTGREQQEPLAFRISDAWMLARIVLLPSPRRLRAWRRHRLLDQDDDVLLAAHEATRDAL